MQSINVYFFDSIEDAQPVIDELNQIAGFPTEDGSTLTYCVALPYEDKFYIPYTLLTHEVMKREPDVMNLPQPHFP